MKNTFDRYTFSTRFLPAVTVLLPVGFGAAAWFPDRFDGWPLLWSLAASGGLGMLLTQTGRDLGKEKQAALWKGWGGAPALQLLRHHGSKLDRHTLARYHLKMKELLPDCRPPTARTENNNPAAADEVYQTWIRYLLEATRDHAKFRLVFAENINYGFRRNLWAMKPAALLVATIGIIAAMARVALALWNHQQVPTIAGVVLVVNVTILVAWMLHVRPRWVRLTADAYAERLLAACEVLEKPAPKPVGV